LKSMDELTVDAGEYEEPYRSRHDVETMDN
jgi:hypothetical protein